MFHKGFCVPPLICALLLAGCAGGTKDEDKAACENDRQNYEYSSGNKSQLEMVEEIMRASANGTVKIFSEMFNVH